MLDGAFVRLATHEVRLEPMTKTAWASIAPLLSGPERFRPPRVRDIAAATARAERDVRRLLKLTGRMGLVDEITHDHFFLRETVDEMTAIAAEVAAATEKGEFTAAQFRDRLANGRKVAIQILEFFDRQGVTLHRADVRRINKHRLDLFAAPVLRSGVAAGGELSLVGRSDFVSSGAARLSQVGSTPARLRQNLLGRRLDDQLLSRTRTAGFPSEDGAFDNCRARIAGVLDSRMHRGCAPWSAGYQHTTRGLRISQ